MGAVKRHSSQEPCPACGGHQGMHRGHAERCSGFTAGEGWFHCSREEFAGQAKFHPNSATWSHREMGRCPCGEVHRDDPTANDPPPRRRTSPGPPAERVPRQPPKKRERGDSGGEFKIVAEYDYRDVNGDLLYQVCRLDPKDFRQRQPAKDGGWQWSMVGRPTTLYRIPELLAGLRAGDTVYVCEGEKDVDALLAVDQVATCNTGGEGKWRDEFGTAFSHAVPGGRVVVIQDRDEVGRAHARTVFSSVSENVPQGVEVSIVEATVGKDAADHLEAGKTVEQLAQMWPIEEGLLERDPRTFKIHQLRMALEQPTTVLDHIASQDHHREQQPLFQPGLIFTGKLRRPQGCVAVAGAPSAGKSYLAISAGVDSAIHGWDVFYLSCEMHQDIIRDRAARAFASADVSTHQWRDAQTRTECIDRAKRATLPARFHHVDVGIGVTIQDVMEFLVGQVTHRPTLVVLDSISSFVDNMAEGPGARDSFGMVGLRDVTRWCVAVRKLTHGHVAFLLLSELNKEGRAKGRFLDHRCDMAVSMTADSEHDHVKGVHVTKNWWGPTGVDGNYLLDWELGRLVRMDDDPHGEQG